MSLKLFFNSRGRLVTGLLVVGWCLSLINLVQLPVQWGARGNFTGITYLAFNFLALLMTIARFKPWYRPENRGHGLEDHFSKTLVPLVYLLVITNLVYLAWQNAWPFILFAIAPLAVINYVNCILIYFYFKDPDTTPPSYFSRSLYSKPH